ncbi:MAG: hypothetical protein IBX57_10295 [Gammaproteobacteria bacterium]|nr:hypothetical protein [Gammaproteobacteria bacterium]
MAYVERNSQGHIIAAHETQQSNAPEFLAIDSPELTQFLVNSASKKDVQAALSTSDVELIRVLEDLINTLIDKKVILFTDLPMVAREKLSNREKIRGHLSSLADLMGDDEGIL